MAKTAGPRLGLTRWSAGTDPVARTDFDGDNADLDSKVMMYAQGTLAARPAAGTPGGGKIYTVVGDGTAEHNRKQFYDNGSTWIAAGSYGTDVLNEASAAGNVALTTRGAASQTADIFNVKNSGGTNLLRVAADGVVTNQTTPGTGPGFNLGGTAAGQFNSIATNKQAVLARGIASQTEAILAAQNDSGANLFRVMPTGNVVISGDIAAATGNITGTLTVGGISTGSGTVGLKNVIATPNAVGDTPLIARGLASQSGNLFSLQNNTSTTLARVSPDGSLSTSGKVKIGNGAGTDTGNYISTDPSLMVYGQGLNASTPVLRVTGGSGSTGNLFEVHNSAGQARYTISNAGNSSLIGNASTQSEFIGDSSTTPTQLFGTTYTPRLEVLTGTDPAAFDDLVVLRHSATGTGAFERRVGIAFKLGTEADASQSNLSGAVGMRSPDASSANPRMYFRVAGTDVGAFDSTGMFTANGKLNIAPATTGPKLQMYASGEGYSIGVQATSMYFRTGGAFNWWRGGTFEEGGAAVPGTGGVQLMNLDSGGRISASRLNVSAANTGTGDTGIRVGLQTGTHLNVGVNTIDSLSATNDALPLYLNYFGTTPELILGSGTAKVRLDSRTLWTGANRVYWGNGVWSAQGGGPIPNDWWFDYTNNQIKVRNDLSQWKIVADDAAFS
jgi:hypothetical protein